MKKTGYKNPPVETQFTSENQPVNKGRKKNSITHYLREFGDAKELEYKIELTDTHGKKKVKEGNIKSESTINELISCTLLAKALNGDLKAITQVLDRTEGKPRQTVDVGLEEPQKPQTVIILPDNKTRKKLADPEN